MTILDIILPDGWVENAIQAHQAAGNQTFANQLIKLQQDAGLEFEPSFNPDDRNNPPGPQTKKLWDAYEPITRIRYNNLQSQNITPQTTPEP